MCGRLLASRAEAEDATQQTFLEAWRCLPRFEQRSRFTTWLTRIAILTCFSFRRRLRRLVLRGDDEADRPAALHILGTPDGQPDALDVTAARAREAAIAEVLMSLGEKKRVVFVLAELQELSSTEIAAILDVPDATVRTRLFHARREVAAAVRRHPGFSDLLRVRGPMRGEP